jgi:ribosomal protein L6P/L9E
VGVKERRKGREERKEVHKSNRGRKVVKEERVRVGMGYRVAWEDEKKGRRSFELGFSEPKRYERKKGVEAAVRANKMGRTRTGEGQRVSNTVHEREKRRKYNDYTGKGVMKKTKAATQQLKEKKPTR